MRWDALLLILGNLTMPLSLWAGTTEVPITASGVVYRLYLTDKAGSSYCALSDRALQRRERYQIPLDDTDLEVSPLYQQTLQEEGWQIVTRSRWLNTVVVRRPDGAAVSADHFGQYDFVREVCQVAGPTTTTTEAAALRHIEPNQNTPVSKWQEEELQQSQVNDNESFRTPIQEIGGDVLYENGCRGEGMLIVLLDGGFTNLPNCPALYDKVVGWYDSYLPTDQEGEQFFSVSNHGSRVLSCLASDTLMGVWGTASGAHYYLIRTEEVETEIPLEEDMWVAGAEMADSLGADLINSSLAYTQFDNADYDHQWSELGQNQAFVSQGADIASTKGMLICCAAGNERKKEWRKVGFPSDCPRVFTVGGTDCQQHPSTFSSVGWITPNVKPDAVCRATSAWVYDVDSQMPIVVNGTSYATPTVCGLMASLWAAHRELRPEELIQLVQETAQQYEQPSPLMGYGLPDFAKAYQVLNGTRGNEDRSGIEELSDRNIGSSSETATYVIKGGENGRFIVQNRRKLFLLSR